MTKLDVAMVVLFSVIFIIVVVGIAIVSARDPRREDICDQCGARNPLHLTHCRICEEPMWTHRDSG